MSRELRPYQSKCHDAVISDYDKGITNLLVTLFTGAGKTYLIIKLLERMGFKRVLWLSFQEELVTQSAMAFIADKFDESFYNYIKEVGFLNYVKDSDARFSLKGFSLGCIKADIFKPDANVVMGSVMTVAKRLDRIAPDFYDCIITDEAHLFGSKSAYSVIQHFKPKLLLGCTATATRSDGMMLSDIFDKISFDYGLGEGIKDGWCTELDAIRIKTNVNLDKVKTTAGDLNQGALSNEVNTLARNQLIVDKWKEYAVGRQTIAFCVSIQHAIDLAEAFQMNGIDAVAVSSNEELTPERSDNITKFKEGKIQIITNVGILVAGFDHVNTGCAIMACPTKSLTKYIQCLDDSTEVLTNDGWKNIDTISKKQKVAAYNKITQEITFEKIDAIYNRERGVDEDMYSISLPETDIRVTGGHRMLISNKITRNKILEPYRFETAEDFCKRKKDSVIPISGFQISKGLPLTNDELIFIGLFLSDGCINKRRNQMYISQSAHQKWNKDIVECLNNCGIKYRIAVKNRITQYSNDSTMNYYYIGVNEFRNLLPWIDKSLNSNFEEITPSQLEFLIYGINLGDGDKTVSEWKRGTYGISTGNVNFANNLQSICVRKGMKCSLAKYGERRYKLHIKPNKQKKHLSFCNDGRDTFKKEEGWKKERVWCVENIKSTLITRRNGKVSIIGNCVGRAARLKKEDYVKQFGQNAIIIDVVDITSKHNLINAWELDKKKSIEERCFTTQEKKDLLLAERAARLVKLEHTRDKDEKVTLLQLPERTLSFNGNIKNLPATEGQLKFLNGLGYDTDNEVYTMQMAKDILDMLPASKDQIEYLKNKGYDTTMATRGQYSRVFYEFEMKSKYKRR